MKKKNTTLVNPFWFLYMLAGNRILTEFSSPAPSGVHFVVQKKEEEEEEIFCANVVWVTLGVKAACFLAAFRNQE